MINRRLLRVKALQELYAYSKSGEKNLALSEKELFHSINKSHELYFMLLLLIVDIRNHADKKIDLIQNRQIKDDQWKVLERLANNRAIHQLEDNIGFKNYISENKISWNDAEKLILYYYDQIVNSEFYQKQNESENTYSQDKKLIEYFYGEILGDSDYFFEYLEEKSVYWNDDIDYIAGMVLKTFRRFKDDMVNTTPLFETFRDEDDKDFIKQLFRRTTVNFKSYDEVIKNNLLNWELDRVAEIDILIIKLAINEAVEFPSIPIKVTMNEYIDIAKFYSTKKSSTFINGILDRIFKQLKEEKVIKKSGRGLIE